MNNIYGHFNLTQNRLDAHRHRFNAGQNFIELEVFGLTNAKPSEVIPPRNNCTYCDLANWQFHFMKCIDQLNSFAIIE